MERWDSPGDIVRWWRTQVLGVSQKQAAARLSTGPTALSNWEAGTRDISIGLDRLDEELGGDGVLSGLLWAYGTCEGLDADTIWTNVFPGPSRPVWMWIRNTEPTIRLESEWGLFRLEADVELPPNGLFVTLGGSVSESPIVVKMSQPGWADFGEGALPQDIPGALVVDAIDLAQPSTAAGMFMDMFSAVMAERIRHEATSSGHTVDGSPGDQLFSRFDSRPTRRPHPWPELPTESAPSSRTRFDQLRRARRLSLTATVVRLADQTGIRIGRDTLRRFETGRGRPLDQLLPVGLDHVLGGMGLLAHQVIRSSRGPGVIWFPHFWRSPIWLEFDGPPDDAVELHWGGWQRRLVVGPPTLVVSHYCEPSSALRIVAGTDTRWSAGVGRRPGALPINHGWVPSSVDDAREATERTSNALLDALRYRADGPPRPE
ncbi:MAG: helix-turn-helix domain-containing protein [Acidimicrobiales bacterium]